MEEEEEEEESSPSSIESVDFTIPFPVFTESPSPPPFLNVDECPPIQRSPPIHESSSTEEFSFSDMEIPFEQRSPPTDEFSFSDIEIPFEQRSPPTDEFSFSDIEIPFEKEPIQDVGDIEIEGGGEEEESPEQQPQPPPPQNIIRRRRRRLDGRSFTISDTFNPSLSIDGEVDLPTIFRILNSLWLVVQDELQQSKSNPNNNNEPLPRIANMNVKVGDTILLIIYG